MDHTRYFCKKKRSPHFEITCTSTTHTGCLCMNGKRKVSVFTEWEKRVAKIFFGFSQSFLFFISTFGAHALAIQFPSRLGWWVKKTCCVVLEMQSYIWVQFFFDLFCLYLFTWMQTCFRSALATRTSCLRDSQQSPASLRPRRVGWVGIYVTHKLSSPVLVDQCWLKNKQMRQKLKFWQFFFSTQMLPPQERLRPSKERGQFFTQNARIGCKVLTHATLPSAATSVMFFFHCPQLSR